MKATDFDLKRDLVLNPSTGVATFHNNRVVVMDAQAMGLLRKNLIDELGIAGARAFLLRLGYGHGYADFTQMQKAHQFDTEMDLLASGPVIHSWEGIVNATPTEIRFDRATGDFFFTGRWLNSYEAEQHLCFMDHHSEPVCWQLTGYASGWCTAFFGSPLLAMEPKCVGKGDDECGWLIQAPDRWNDPLAVAYLDALRPLMGV